VRSGRAKRDIKTATRGRRMFLRLY
jgi:hypothetical protein